MRGFGSPPWCAVLMGEIWCAALMCRFGAPLCGAVLVCRLGEAWQRFWCAALVGDFWCAALVCRLGVPPWWEILVCRLGVPPWWGLAKAWQNFGVPLWCAALVCRLGGRNLVCRLGVPLCSEVFGRGSALMMELQSSTLVGPLRLVESLNGSGSFIDRCR